MLEVIFASLVMEVGMFTIDGKVLVSVKKAELVQLETEAALWLKVTSVNTSKKESGSPSGVSQTPRVV
jgi:hypothetical protein